MITTLFAHAPLTVWQILASKSDLIAATLIPTIPSIIAAVAAYRANERGKINSAAIAENTAITQATAAKADEIHSQVVATR